MKKEHFIMRRLDKLLKENPSTDWANEWIDCISYLCHCKKCIANLRANDGDVEMFDRIFKKREA